MLSLFMPLKQDVKMIIIVRIIRYGLLEVKKLKDAINFIILSIKVIFSSLIRAIIKCHRK
jgi:hypothetical protein